MVGPSYSGKTSLVRRFVNNSYDDYQDQSSYDEYERELNYEGKTLCFNIKDCGASPELWDLRYQAMRDNDIAIICYSVNDVTSV